MPRCSRWAPDLDGHVVAALSDLGDRPGWLTVANALAAFLDRGSSSRNVLGDALQALVRVDAADPDPGGPDYDRPGRRRIDTFVTRAIVWSRRAEPDTDLTPVREAARDLART